MSTILTILVSLEEFRPQLLDFAARTVKAVQGQPEPRDDIRLLTDSLTKTQLVQKHDVPANVIEVTDIEDIWIRDFGLVQASQPRSP